MIESAWKRGLKRCWNIGIRRELVEVRFTTQKLQIFSYLREATNATLQTGLASDSEAAWNELQTACCVLCTVLTQIKALMSAWLCWHQQRRLWRLGVGSAAQVEPMMSAYELLSNNLVGWVWLRSWLGYFASLIT